MSTPAREITRDELIARLGSTGDGQMPVFIPCPHCCGDNEQLDTVSEGDINIVSRQYSYGILIGRTGECLEDHREDGLERN